MGILTNIFENRISKALEKQIYDALNPVVWLETSKEESFIKDGSNLVSDWIDLNSGIRASQFAGSSQPTFVSNVQNGLNGLSFDGVNDWMVLPNSLNLGTEGQEYEFYVVAKSSSAEVQFFLSETVNNFEFHLNGDAGLRGISNGPPYMDIGATNDFSDNQTHIFNLTVKTNADGFVRVEDLNLQSDTQSNKFSTLAGFNAFHIGIRGGGFGPFNGYLFEIIILNRNASAQNRNLLITYLKNKWGI